MQTIKCFNFDLSGIARSIYSHMERMQHMQQLPTPLLCGQRAAVLASAVPLADHWRFLA
jgi:hypothetical protein